ncbi:hypothetical protein P4O66_000805 [Electrophorus voltai]|uniref:Contactin associated protein-like 5a n=1 Tax=Electrophorus voltai TaxID=2609070 RepID=A0AAD8ZED2_9TELE|nr:hypothetical protein P4O66_000805 [Electrophorus voltai]
MEVTAVATQGRYGSHDWVSAYMLLYSDTGRVWKQYRHEDIVGRLVGNMNSDSVVHHKLSHSIRTRFLRFVPLGWNPSGRVGLRVEVYGCAYNDTRVRSSSGRTVVTLGSLLDDQHWHSVLIERFNKQVNFTLDRQTQHFRTKGDGDSLEVDYEGNVTFSCSEPQLVAATFLSSSSSFLSLPAPLPTLEGLSVRLQFRTWNPDGLLLSSQLASDYEPRYLLLQISSGRLRLTHQTSSLKTSEVSTGQRVNDGLWHMVSLSSRGLQIALTLDNEPASTIQLEHYLEPRDNYYFGGCPVAHNDSSCMNPTMAFQGCVRLILINNQPMDLMLIQQGIMGRWNQLQFDMCGIQDRYDMQCGVRKVSESIVSVCSKSPTCDVDIKFPLQSIYEASCESYRLVGSTSGYFSIDPDGSGPLGPIQVYCNMTENKVWTVIDHNGTGQVRVRGSTPERIYSSRFDYGASPEQLGALVAESQYCQQRLTYRCRRSRLFNTWDGVPLSWWLDRSGERKTYWGGFLPGVQQCACSLEENCVDMNFFCNCDADRDSWENDTGILSYKADLPVSGIAIGDTNRLGSEALYSVGPLECSGDKSLWNAASFYEETSYLHFPAFHIEFSFDISFYFKTGAPSGVFLENLGLRDFIRVELSSPSAVTFSFDAGDGPAVLSVKSPVPLNDRQWHWVRAERNVKEASLQVDQLPLRFLQAPADAHLRLQLNSQLFVGGTASRQRGFLGCVRALSVNGITLDLDERAKMSPGVTPGCPGHCSSSAGFCHNRGRCVEKSSGYTCDCTHSAYGGPSCKEEVSVSFERGSSVTYTFQEPFSFMQNRTAQASSASSAYPKAREHMALSFLTTQTPAMLLTANTFTQQYLAVILAHNGSLQIWYRLHKERSPSVFSPVSTSLADGLIHRLRLHREGQDVYVQVDEDNKKYTLSYDAEFNSMRSLTLGKVTGSDALDEEVAQAGSRGFIGCFSSVQYNHVAPLKAALLNRGSSLVSIRGNLLESNCGALADLSTSKSRLDHGEEVGKDNKAHEDDTQRDSAVIGGAFYYLNLLYGTICKSR